MCLKICEFWTWRILLFAISIISVLVSFVLGPLHTLFYFLGLRPELNEYFDTEPDYAYLLCFILVVLWVIFVSNLILLLACCYVNPKLISCYVLLVLMNMIFSFGVATRYVIHCTMIDNKCFDHSKTRVGDDKGAALILFAADLLYLVASVVIIFIACNYKLGMR